MESFRTSRARWFHRYERAARSVAELGLGGLLSLIAGSVGRRRNGGDSARKDGHNDSTQHKPS
jgi:hypothetical protein